MFATADLENGGCGRGDSHTLNVVMLNELYLLLRSFERHLGIYRDGSDLRPVKMRWYLQP